MNTNPTSTKIATKGAQSPDGSPVELSSCWSRIGIVGGDGTCPDLQRFIHCRNCPVYSAAGVQLLNRPLLPDYRDEWTRQFAGRKTKAAPGRISILVFRVAGEWLALPTQIFQEVAEHRRIHSIPHRRHGIVAGLVNVRGELLICVSLVRLLGLEPEARPQPQSTSYDRLLVVTHRGTRLTFPVDEVHGVWRIRPDDLKEVPATVARAEPTYTRGVWSWQGRSVGCLDEELLLSALNRGLS